MDIDCKGKYYDNMEIFELRELISRFYLGETTPEEYDRLAVFFRDCINLPEDLEEERLLFSELSDNKDITIPSELDNRIETAVERELAFSGFRRRKKIGYYSAAVACCMILLACVLGMMLPGSMGGAGGSEQEMSFAMTKSLPSDSSTLIAMAAPSYDSGISDSVGVIHQNHQLMIRSNGGNGKSSKVASDLSSRSRTETSVPSGDTVMVMEEPLVITENMVHKINDPRLNLSAEECNMLDRNYYVVTDEREASAILNTIALKMSNNRGMSCLYAGDVSNQSDMIKL